MTLSHIRRNIFRPELWMARKCFMCGRETPAGKILCESCDKPRKPRPAGQPTLAAPSERGGDESGTANVSQMHALDAFPPAPVVQFPVASATPAITSVVNLLIASGVATILVAADRSVKFISDAAMKLFDATQSELADLGYIEKTTGIRIGDLSSPASAGARIRERNVLFSLVPVSSGGGGAVLIFRPTDPLNESQASFVTYVREAVLEPLRALRETLHAAGTSGVSRALLDDSAATLDQVLSSLELAPGVDQRVHGARPVPRVTDVVRRVADRFVPVADLKGVQLQVDVQDLDERFANHEQLSDALAILMDNALHYVAPGGMVVIGVRWMEHKNKPILLFFVMDNGPLVPEHLRQTIFEPSFVWNPAGERTGRGLFKCREFAVNHGGSVWVESRTGKACTFFLRVRPDEHR